MDPLPTVGLYRKIQANYSHAKLYIELLIRYSIKSNFLSPNFFYINKFTVRLSYNEGIYFTKNPKSIFQHIYKNASGTILTSELDIKEDAGDMELHINGILPELRL